MLAPGCVIGRGLLVTCGLLLLSSASAARRSEWAFPIQLDLLNLFIYVKTGGEGIVLLACDPDVRQGYTGESLSDNWCLPAAIAC